MSAVTNSETPILTPANGNGHAPSGMQDTLHLPDHLPWRTRFKEYLRRRGARWETITVDGRVVEKGFVISPAIAAVLLAAFLGALGWAYQSSTADQRETRDSIIRMETMLNERTRVFDQQQAKIEAELKDERALAQMYREDQNKKQFKTALALKQKGINVE